MLNLPFPDTNLKPLLHTICKLNNHDWPSDPGKCHRSNRPTFSQEVAYPEVTGHILDFFLRGPSTDIPNLVLSALISFFFLPCDRISWRLEPKTL